MVYLEKLAGIDEGWGNGFVEPPNRVNQAKAAWAYDVADVTSRLERLALGLDDRELRQVIEHDEFENLVAHAAEVAGVEVFPYEEVILDGEVGSVVVVEAEDGGKKTVFRRVEDMLYSRVEKFSKDERARTLLDTFVTHIQPATVAMELGETVVFFSPPNWGGELESEYGFIYLLKKQAELETGAALVRGVAVKLDLTEEEYQSLYRHHSRRVYGEAFEGEPRKGATPVFVATSDWSEAELLETLLEPVRPKKEGRVELLGEAKHVGKWLEQEKERYGQLRLGLESRKEQWGAGLMARNQEAVKQMVVEVQMDALHQADPEKYGQLVRELEEKGWVEFLVACGLIRWNQGIDLKPEDLALMGTPDWEKKIFICENCGHVHHIDVDAGVTVTECEMCHASAIC